MVDMLRDIKAGFAPGQHSEVEVASANPQQVAAPRPPPEEEGAEEEGAQLPGEGGDDEVPSRLRPIGQTLRQRREEQRQRERQVLMDALSGDSWTSSLFLSTSSAGPPAQ